MLLSEIVTAGKNGQFRTPRHIIRTMCDLVDPRFDDRICLRTYHDDYHDWPPLMLFDLVNDPHQQHNLAEQRPELVDRAMRLLADWQHEMMRSSKSNVDPMMTVLREGGAYHTRGMLPAYLERLRATGRAHHAEALARRHSGELGRLVHS